MAAQKARPLASIEHSLDGDVIVIMRDGTVVPLEELPQAELFRTASRLGVKVRNGDGWITKAEAMARARAAVPVGEARDIRRDSDLNGSPPLTPMVPNLDVEVRQTPTQTPDVDAGLTALRNLIGGVDPAHVNALVDAQVNRRTVEVHAAVQQALDIAADVSATISRAADDLAPTILAAAESAALEALAMLRPTQITINERPSITIDRALHSSFEPVLRMLSAGCHVMMVGPAGTGKSRIAADAAESLGLPFYSVSVHPQLPASQLAGYNDANGNYVRTPFREAWEHGGVFCFDELDNGHPGTLAMVNQALSGEEVAFADGMVKRHTDFLCVGTANTYGTGPNAQYVGRQALDAATLDRFVQVTVDVDEALEAHLVSSILDLGRADAWLTAVRRMRRNITENALRVICSPRTSLDGAKMIHAGFSMRQAADAKVLARLPEDQATKITNGVVF